MDERIELMAREASQAQRMTLECLKVATEQMITLIANDTLRTEEGRAGACEHHAKHIGIAKQLMKSFVPKALVMKDELKALGQSDKQAEILTDIWMAKVLMQLEKHRV